MITKKVLVRVFTVAVLIALIPTLAITWGDDGHRTVNRVAAEKIPADMPQFLKAGAKQVEYEGPEPDRWRSPLEKPLAEAQAPDHFMDMEYVDWLNPLPADRNAFNRAIYERRASHPEEAAFMLPEKVGYQPYIAIEIFDRLKVAFREYRRARQKGLPTAHAEANALFYAGWLGHYVADGANPLHTSKHYNGWVGDNPKGYTTAHDIHWKMEGPFVARNIEQLPFEEFVGAPKHLDDPFQDYIAYLRDSQRLVPQVYELEKACGFEGNGTPESREFIRRRLGVGAQMLLNLWYTAWVDSAKEPEPYRPPKSEKKKEPKCPPEAASAAGGK